jgi:multidrug resistance efflux pump
VGLERARIALADVQNEYSKALDRPWEDQAIRDSWADRLEQVQLDYKAAEAQLQSALDSQRAYQVGLNILAAQVEEAKTQLSQAVVERDTFTTTLEILAADVDASRLSLDALRTWDNPYRDEASAQAIAQAQALLAKTRIAVDRLKVQLEDAELVAPFDGTVVDVPVEVGDLVSPAQVAVSLAALDQLEVRTTDLTELDVAQVAVGQPVKITVDALPGAEFAGAVQEISLRGQDYRGDVVYEVTVSLDNDQETAALRWGMTTMVEIETR